MKRAIAWFAANPVAANLMMVVILTAGVFSLPTVQQKMFPDLDIDIVTVTVPYLGASPSEVEEGVCIRIEEEINGLNGIERITSLSAEGMCQVMVEVLEGHPSQQALSEIKNAVDAITTFPRETEKPIVNLLDIRHNVVQIALSGDVDEKVLRYYGEQIRDGLSSLPSITSVDLINVRDFEVTLEVSETSLRRYGLTFEQVANAVRQSSLDLPGGSIRADSGEILLRSKGQAYTGQDFSEIVVLTRDDGTRLRLADVATVVDGFVETDRTAHFDQKRSVMIRVFRVGDQRLIDISRDAVAYIDSIGPQLPEGLSTTVWRNNSNYLRDRLNVLLNSGAWGFGLVFVVLAMFLRLRLAFWVAIGVPVSMMGAVACFSPLGLSIDVLTLFAFIMVLGLLVDDAIVVGENIHSHQERSEDPLEAAIAGAQEVSVPVIFGVLTTVAAFLPILAGPGGMGRFFGFIGIVVVLCLFFSVVESQLILPAHLAHHSGSFGNNAPTTGVRGVWKQIQQSLNTSLSRLARTGYRPLLDFALSWRYAAVALAVGLLVITLSLGYFGRMKWRFFPAVQSDYVSASVTLPVGAPIENTEAAVQQLVESAERTRRMMDAEIGKTNGIVKHVMAISGGSVEAGTPTLETTMGSRGATHKGEVSIELMTGEDRAVSPRQFVSRWRAETPPIPEAEEVLFVSDYINFGDPIDLQLTSSDVAQLELAAEYVKARLAKYEGVFDIADSFQGGKAEVQLDILPGAEALGLTLSDLALQVRQAFYGEEAQRIQRGRDDIRVMVRYPEAERTSIADLENLRIRTDKGNEVPFYAVAKAEMGKGYSTIKRIDRQRTINVTADVDSTRGNASEIVTSLSRTFLPQLVREFPNIQVTLEGEQAEQSETFASLLRNGMMALIVIYTLLAVPLRSYGQPLIIMAVIPFGLVGAVGGHLLFGRDFSFMSVFGVVALSGVVVNASLVLVHAINRLRSEGMSIEDAVKAAGILRFRPIVLTSITTFVGLTPLMLTKEMGAQFLIPMSISLSFGVIFATVISLLLVPCGYLILNDWRRNLRRSLARTGILSTEGQPLETP